jgi:endonuclease/exonuclease/phosphatase family metal-dependent hydrolase
VIFRVATYNIHKCKGVDWRVSSARIAEVIGCLESDIVATQEILLPQAEQISRHIGVPFTFGTARQHAGEPYGNALFSKLPVVSQQVYDLTVPGREQRQCLRVSFEVPGAGIRVHFFALHLGTSFTERRRQARLLLSSDILMSPEFKTHRIVAGDFNEWTYGLASQLLSKHLQSADIVMHLKRRSTYPGLVPFMHLDHIYYDRDFALRDMHLHRNKLSLLASDHLPLLADFAI